MLWAAAAALVPAMQKGNETARNLHIALNVLNVLLFTLDQVHLTTIYLAIDIISHIFLAIS